MATDRRAEVTWNGSLMDGSGTITSTTSGAIGEQAVTWAARAEDATSGRTSPEELIAAAHATCFSMALSHGLAGAGHPPTTIDTKADVSFQAGTGITGITLTVVGDVPGITAEEFDAAAKDAKQNCPVSQALKAVPITMESSFKG